MWYGVFSEYELMKELVRKMIQDMGEDPEREGLKDTPERVENAMAFLTSGYKSSIDDIINNAIFQAENGQMVIVKDIELYSLCEHHILPFFGTAHVGYIPDQKIIGLSKIPRLVNHFSRRLQIQERLTHQVADSLMDILSPKGVMVVLQAKHLCGMMRGVEKQNSSMITSAVKGEFETNASYRSEFMNFINH